MRVLIIGGTGFIGPHIIGVLHRSGHHVTIYHRGRHETELPEAVRHIHSPQAGIPVLRFPDALIDPRPDLVLHMFPVGEADARAVVSRFSGVARRLVVISSGDVYRAYGRLLGSEPGPPEPVPLTETAALRSSLYPYRGVASGPEDWTFHYEKIRVERVVLEQHSLPATVLRLPAVYGPGDPYHRLRPYIKRMEDRRPAILLESAQLAWRWTHGYVENVAQAIALTVVNQRSAGEVYNVGEPETPTYGQRVREIGSVMNWTGSVVALGWDRLPPHLRPPYQPQQDLVLDTTKLRNELGYAETVPPDEALRRTVTWERANPSPAGDPGAEEYATEDAALALV
jgi:nucleoside-diphosphate-sugar epimerase